MLKALLTGLILLGVSGCSHAPVPRSSDDAAFVELIESHTRQVQGYNGINNVYEVRATLVTREIGEKQLESQARDYLWSDSLLQTEREKLTQERSHSTLVFMDFFSPDSSYDDLTSSSTIWRIFLDTAGKRYAGTIERVRRPYADVQSLFPYHNKWSTPYEVRFNVPLAHVEASTATMIITGPVGSESLRFQ